MKETFGKIGQAIKRFGKEVFAFLTSSIFIKNIAGILVMLMVLFFFTTFWLKCYTNHGEALHMANFEGMNLLDVKDIAREKGFQLKVDSIDLLDVPPLTVIKQNPRPEAMVKEKRTIYLTVSQVSRDLVEIPRMEGTLEAYDQYVKLLKQNDLIPVRRTKVNSRVAQNTILQVLYNEKDITDKVRDGKFEKIPRGSRLTMVISEKGNGNTRVPELICKTLEEAKLILENYNLNVGTIDYDQTINDKKTAFVWLQDPVKGSSIRFGEQVKLRVTQYLPDDCEDSINEVEAPRESDEEEDESF